MVTGKQLPNGTEAKPPPQLLWSILAAWFPEQNTKWGLKFFRTFDLVYKLLGFFFWAPLC